MTATPGGQSTRPVRTCSIAGCDRTVCARGLCRMHYVIEWRAGTVTERPTRDRTSPRCAADHAHDLVCYNDHGCRCKPCRHLRHMDRQRRRARLRAYGRADEIRDRVPVGPVREHIAALMAEGTFSLQAIADAAEVSKSAVDWAYFGPRGERRGGPADNVAERTMNTRSATRILAVTSDIVTPGRLPATGTVRRLRALVAIGYSKPYLGDRMRMNPGNFHSLINGHQAIVLAATATAATQLFDQHSMAPRTGATADRARSIAARHHWLPPLAWDDIDHDTEPAALADAVDEEIDEMAVEIAVMGERVRLTPLERRAAVTHLVAKERLSDPQVAKRLHINERTVLRIRQELGLESAVGADRQLRPKREAVAS